MSGLETKYAASAKGAAVNLAAGHWLSRPGFSLVLALTLAVLSTFVAFQQAPHRNAYRPSPQFLSWDYWGYPVERNAFRRLPAIAGNLNDLAVSDDGRHIWAVGDGGLIVYSEDGGVNWRQGRIGPAPTAPVARADGFWIKEAQAGMPVANQQQQSVQTKADNAPLSVRKTDGVEGVLGVPNATLKLNESPTLAATNSQESAALVPAPTLKINESSALNSPAQALSAANSNSEPPLLNYKNSPQTSAADKAGESVLPPPAQQQKPNERDPTRANLTSVHFVDSIHGWAVGADGVILATADGGISWQPQTSGVLQRLNDVNFADSSHGWAVGTRGVILTTTDGGNSWESQIVAGEPYLSSVKFSDTLRGWAVGFGGVIVVTDDGGKHWQAQVSPTKQHFNAVDFVDNLRGWVVGFEGVIVTTNDGGKTWRQLPNDSSKTLFSIHFRKDGSRGWAIGEGGTLLATTDGGNSWQAQNSGTSSLLFSVYFLQDGLHGWAVGTGGTIVISSDGGHSWQPASQKSLTAVQFLNNLQRGWASGADGVVLSSVDAGKNWQVQESQTGEFLSDLQMLSDGRHGWLIGNNGVILDTADGGENWRTQNSKDKGWLARVQFRGDGSRGWAVGENGLIATQDGGKAWEFDAKLGKKHLLALYFTTDGRRGWVTGLLPGEIYVTADGGGTWRSQAQVSSRRILDLQFQADGLRGWAVGENGAILSTRDGGTNWQSHVSSTQQNLRELAFASDGSRGWAVGAGGTLVATQNGGDTWQAQASNTLANLLDIHADDEGRHAWVVGEAGTLLATSDGGEHWLDPVLSYQRYPAPWYYLSWLPVMLSFSRGLRLRLSELREPEALDPALGINPAATSDKPTGPGSRDYLGSLRLAKDLSEFLRNENTQPPLTLAITGDWGSGKSSVMNYLQAELRREGFRPVWYNAWHHQEEQQVLGSILECVRRQATPPLWPGLLPGLWFRFRLLTHQRFWPQLLLALILTGLCWMMVFSYFHEESDENQVLHYASHLADLEQPAVLTAQGHARLCARTDSGNPGKPPADTAFSVTDCQKLQCLVNADVSGETTAQAACIETVSRFASDDDLLEQATKLVGHELTRERKQAIVKQLEHIPGTVPFALPAWLTALLTVLTTVAGVVAVKGASLFGVASTDLLKTAISKAGVIEAAEPVGTRQIWERCFERLTRLLGRRRLVLFIDDLDRCSREHALRVLETCNFLVSSGELFIVMGIAPKYVLANVKLHFKELAEALHEFDDNGSAEAEAKAETNQTNTTSQKPRSLARFYLQKLINIEVPVPSADSEAMLNLLTGSGGEEDIRGQQEQNEQKNGERQMLAIKSLVLLAALAWTAYHASQPIPGAPKPQTYTAPLLPEAASKPADSQVEPIAEKPDTLKADSRITSFRADFQPEQLTRWPQHLGMGWLALFTLLAGGLAWIGRDEKARSWLVDYLEKAYKALGRDWFGPRQTQDTPEFAAALRIWYPLIHETHSQPPQINSPRTVKAFLNRLRCFASRWPKTAGAHGEAQLVLLAALHFYLGEGEYERVVDTLKSGVQNVRVPSWLPGLFKQHKLKFGPPSDDDCRLFKYFIENLEIHKPQ